MLTRDLLLAALEHLPDPVALLRAERDEHGRATDLRIDYLNRAAALRQLDPQDTLGALASEVWPQMVTTGVLAACLRALETGLPQAGSMLFRPEDGTVPRGYDHRAVPLDDDTLLWTLRDTDAQLRRAQVLADVTTALARADGLDDVAELLVDTAVRLIGAAASAVAVDGPAPARCVVHTSRGLPGDHARSFDAAAPDPMAHVVLTREPLFLANDEHGPFASSAVVPLLFHDHAFGAVSFHFGERHAFDDDERGFLAALAAQCAQALEWSRAREDARRRRAQMFALSEVGDALASSLDVDTTLDNVAATVVGALADACLIHLREGDGPPRLVAVAHRDEASLPAVARLAERHPPPLDDESWQRAGDLASGDAVVADQVVLDGDLDGAPAAYARLIAPLRHRGEVRGALVLVNDARRGFPAGDVPFASELARRSEMALANAQAYSSQREIAHRLQISLLATPAVSVPGLTVAARYRPAQADAHVGGDWYDMFELADGRTALVIGDVMGHDIAAAAAMGQLRTLLRGVSYDGATPPDAILRRLDEINSGLAITAFATVLVVNVDAVVPGGPAQLRVSNAGHLPPLVLKPGGGASLVSSPTDPPLGAGMDVERRCVTLDVEPGSTLLLYTDGLVETREDPLDERLAVLESVAGGLSGLAPGELLDELLETFDGHADDVAVLAMRVEGAP